MPAIIKGENLPKSTADRLREFRDDLISALALGTTEDWASTVALVVDSDAPRLTFPIPIGAAGYQEFKGDIKYRSLFNRQADVRPKLWQDGVSAPADEVEQPNFIGFEQQPAIMADMAQRSPNKWVRDIIEANPLLDLYRDQELNTASTINLFHASHLVNVLNPASATYTNILTSGVGGFTVANVGAWMSYFRGLQAPNGEALGLRLTHVLVPAAQEVAAVNFFATEYLLRTIKNVAGTENVAATQEYNPYKGAVKVLVSDELTNASVVYPMALNKPGMMPFAVQRPAGGVPEINVLDRDSAMFETSRKVGVNAFLKGYAAALLPQPVAKVTFS